MDQDLLEPSWAFGFALAVVEFVAVAVGVVEMDPIQIGVATF